MVKIGDKVRFLNAVGGGIVRKFINKDMVSVEENDGFEMPVLVRDCVVIADAGEVTAMKKGGDSAQSIQQSLSGDMPVREVRGRDELNVYLAYIPQDSRMLQTTSYDCYLVNDSNYRLFFTYLSKVDANWKSRYAGMVDPNTKLHLELFGKEKLNDIERVAVQLVAFKSDKDFVLRQPVSIEIKIDTVKFYKLHSFRMNEFFDEEAMLYPIVVNGAAQEQVSVSADELEAALKSKIASDKYKAKPQQLRIRDGVVEIDLHIDELIDTIAGMEPKDILEYQMEFFNKTIAQYKGRQGQKIVFIHGKGDGVLRKSIIDELKRKYPRFGSQDASFREYGYGATMVTIK